MSDEESDRVDAEDFDVLYVESEEQKNLAKSVPYVRKWIANTKLNIFQPISVNNAYNTRK